MVLHFHAARGSRRARVSLALLLAALGVLASPPSSLAQQTSNRVRHRLETVPLDPNNPHGPYLGQRPPGTTPEIFGPGFISTPQRSVGGIAFSPDGNGIYFGSTGVWVTRQVSGVWTTPGPAPFRGSDRSFEPGMAPNGNRLYFASTMDHDANGSQIWYVDRSGSGWAEPLKVGPSSPTGFKMAPTAAANGNLYFTAGQGQMGWFYMARWSNGAFQAAVRLPSTINAFNRMDHSFIAPDESTLVFAVVTTGGQQLHVSFRRSDGSWRTPVRLPASVNATINQIQPSISPDGRYLFFTRFNGVHGDIWWVDARVVFDLRPTAQDLELERAAGAR